MSTLRPLNSLLKIGIADPSLSKNDNFYKLAAIKDMSSLFVSIAIGPNRTAFEEDNMRVNASVGAIHANVDGIEKVMELVKAQPRRARLPEHERHHRPVVTPAVSSTNMTMLTNRFYFVQ